MLAPRPAGGVTGSRPNRQSAVRHVLCEQENLRELEFSLERDGTKVIFNARR